MSTRSARSLRTLQEKTHILIHVVLPSDYSGSAELHPHLRGCIVHHAKLPPRLLLSSHLAIRLLICVSVRLLLWLLLRHVHWLLGHLGMIDRRTREALVRILHRHRATILRVHGRRGEALVLVAAIQELGLRWGTGVEVARVDGVLTSSDSRQK